MYVLLSKQFVQYYVNWFIESLTAFRGPDVMQVSSMIRLFFLHLRVSRYAPRVPQTLTSLVIFVSQSQDLLYQSTQCRNSRKNMCIGKGQRNQVQAYWVLLLRSLGCVLPAVDSGDKRKISPHRKPICVLGSIVLCFYIIFYVSITADTQYYISFEYTTQ